MHVRAPSDKCPANYNGRSSDKCLCMSVLRRTNVRVNVRDKRHVASPRLRHVYKSSLEPLKNFSRAWTSGSTNQIVSNVLDHATSEVHKAAMARLRADHAKASGGSAVLSSTIGRGLSTLDHETRSRMGRKFDLCVVIAKQSIPFAKYPALLQLEECHARPSLSLASSLEVGVRASLIHFLQKSFLGAADGGTTDAGNVEEELIAILYCAKDDASQQMTTNSRFLSLRSPAKANATVLYANIDS